MILLRALGNCVIETPESHLTPNQEILFATALFFSLSGNRKITRDAIEQALWPDLERSGRAHHRLRQTILKLKESGFPIVRADGFLRCANPIRTDVDRLLAAASDHPLPLLPDSFLFLPDYAPRVSTVYSHWLDAKRLEVNSALIRILLEHIRHARNHGQWAKVEALTQACGEIDPYNEEAIFARAESVALRGGKLEALALLDDYATELGDAPAEMRAPVNQMRRRISERREPPAYAAREKPLLGRADDIAVLNTALTAADAGSGQTIVIEGDIGMGKTRLVNEFGDFALLKGGEVLYTRAQPSDKIRPLSVFIDLVPALRKLRGAIGSKPESLECLNRLTQHAPAYPAWSRGGDPHSIADNILSAMLDLLEAVSEEKTIVVVVDDAQWLDPASATLCESIAHWMDSKKMLLVFCVRGDASDWALATKLHRVKLLRLLPLAVEDSTKLAKAFLSSRGKTSSPADISRFVQAGEGNPFFLAELVSQWTESGCTHATPPSLIAITNQRLDRLSRRALQILQACVVLGRFSSIARLEKVLEIPAFELVEGLDDLGKSSIIRVEQLPGEYSDPRILCSNDFVGSAALRLLSGPGEVAMHRRVGLVLEQETDADYSPSLLRESALHWEKAGDSAHAIGLTVSYADHLLRIGFPSEAIQSYRKAIGFCASAPQQTGVLAKLVFALYAIGSWREVCETVKELNSLEGGTNGHDAHSEIELVNLEAKWRSSNEWSDLLVRVKDCIFAEDASDTHRVRAAALGLKLATNVGAGEELDHIYSAVENVLGSPSIDEEARLYVEMVYHIDRGDMDRGKRAAEHLVARERGKGSVADLVWSLVNAAQAMRRCGLMKSSIEYLNEAFELATRSNLPTRARTVAHHLVRTSLAQNDIALARHWLKIAKDYPTPSEDLHTRHEHLYYGSRIALIDGNLIEASKLCDQISSPNDQSLLRKISLVALRLRLATSRRAGRAHVRRLLRDLIELYEVECARGGQDFEAFSLYLGRRYVGEECLAVKQLQDYVRLFRRERGDPSQEILEALVS